MTYNIPYSFIPGTKAKAQEVNANFKYLADSLTDINGETKTHIYTVNDLNGLNKSINSITYEDRN